MTVEETLIWAIAKKIKPYMRPDQPTITSIAFAETKQGYDFYRVSIAPSVIEDLVTSHELSIVGVEATTQVRDVVNGSLIHIPKDRQITCTLVAFDSLGLASVPSEEYSFSTHSTAPFTGLDPVTD
jgi:hypothetical protein